MTSIIHSTVHHVGDESDNSPLLQMIRLLNEQEDVEDCWNLLASALSNLIVHYKDESEYVKFVDEFSYNVRQGIAAHITILKHATN